MTSPDQITRNTERLLSELPPDVTLQAAVKTRTIAEIETAYTAGIRHFGHNYVQEAQPMIRSAKFHGCWHMIGHLQRNKAADAVNLFTMVESLDSLRLANELEKRCADQGKILEVLIEINSGAEDDKTGILPREVPVLAQAVIGLAHLRLVGLMTMGPLGGDAEEARPYFKKTRRLFEQLRAETRRGSDFRVLSMGMSASYQIAIDEGATMVRIGTLLFGPRH